MDVEEHQKLLISKLQDLVRKKDEEVIEKEKALKVNSAVATQL